MQIKMKLFLNPPQHTDSVACLLFRSLGFQKLLVGGLQVGGMQDLHGTTNTVYGTTFTDAEDSEIWQKKAMN